MPIAFSGRTRWMPLALFALAAVSCTGTPPADGARPLTILYPGDERILGPHWEMPAKFLMFLPLARIDAHGERVGVLARRWEHSPDFRTWTIHLRTDVRWHDGTPFTARDVGFTYALYGHPEVLWDPPGLRTVEVLDDSTLTMTMHRAVGHPISTWETFYPSHLLDTLDPAQFTSWAFWTRPVGNGPYRYVRHVPNTMIQLERNPAYFRGPPSVEGVILKFASETASGLPELLSGNVDVLGWAGRNDVERLRGDPAYRITYEVGAATRGIMWKASHPVFADARVRRAMTHAIDRRELHGLLGYPAGLPLPDGPFSERQFRQGVLPPPLAHDSLEAARLLEAAGWGDTDGDGTRDRHGRPMRFTLLAPAQERAAAVYVQHQLARQGIDARLSIVDLNVVRQRSRAGDFEAILVWLNRSRDTRFFGSEGVAGYRNARVDTLLTRLTATFDPAARDTLYAELDEIFRRDQPATALIPNVTQFVVPAWLRGLESPFRADPVVHLEFLEIAGS